MTITLNHDQERVLREVVNLGLATTPEEAIDQAFDGLRERLPFQPDGADDEVAAVARNSQPLGSVISSHWAECPLRSCCKKAGREPNCPGCVSCLDVVLSR
jgi:hypothetical protein